MIRTVLILAAAFFAAATFLAPAAQACISCSYVPEVVHTPVKSRPLEKKRIAVSKKSAPAATPKRLAKAAPAPKKSAPAPVVTAEAAPAKTDAKADTAEPTVDEIKTASLDDPHSESNAGGESGLSCRKFIPTVGVTVSVPCE